MKLTDQQSAILGKMRMTPMTAEEIRLKVGATATNPRAFAALLLRMRDRGLIDMADTSSPVTYVATPVGVAAYLEAWRRSGDIK